MTAPDPIAHATACLSAARSAEEPDVQAFYLASCRTALDAVEEQLARLRLNLKAVEREMARRDA